ncbi:uncharacterized protein IL334_002235 [Kwoniella shivajii]|uniref:Endonuclease III homolog n=1 Tax=Kwoniella shivajii TaxID=564305 RepID=A0ABZ1CY93_9TREE|nr:hypothetical protein IL334_002235 [Kwoniella shivajii]
MTSPRSSGAAYDYQTGSLSFHRDSLPNVAQSVIADHQPLSTIEVASNLTPTSFTSLRRTTRSSVSTSSAGDPSIPSIAGKKTKFDASKYQYHPSTPPRKKLKVETTTPISVKAENVTEESPRTPKSASKKSLPQLALAKPHPAPLQWEEQYKLIERMRKGIIAPVDDMGCERPRTVINDDPKTLRFHILISLMLSSQTKDPVTSAAVTNLHDTLTGGLTARSLANATTETVQTCINKVGFWRRKADYIQDAAKYLLEKENGDVPNTLEGLCALKGVGPKMAFLALQCAWDINAGIGVDVHVHRITNRLKWHKPPTTTPEATRLNLQSWLPSKLHKPINPMLVGFGQVICLPVGPRCDICLLGQNKLCPSRITNVKSQGRKEVLYTFNKEEDDEMLPKLEIGYEGVFPTTGLVRMKREPSPEPRGVKMERDVGLEELVEEPGMEKVYEVLEVLDKVDGAKGVDGESLSR